MGGCYPQSMYTFLFENPIFENYVTNYVEETQQALNDSVSFEQFKTIFWENGFPNIMIDFLGYLTGQK